MSEPAGRVFRLRVEGASAERMRLTLFQQRPANERGNGTSRPATTTPNGRAGTFERIGTLEGTSLLVAVDQVLELLRGEGYRGLQAPDGVLGRRGTAREFSLGERTGVRLGLLFLALRPLRRVERMERVAGGIRRMTDEEAYYWFSKCVASGTAQRARRALRILLAGE